MQAKGRWRPWALSILAVVMSIWIVVSSPSFQECVSEHKDKHGSQSLKERATKFFGSIKVRQDCTGHFLENNGEAVIAVFTIVLAVSTIFLWTSTKEAADRQERMSRTHERAYIFGGGPAGDPRFQTINDVGDVFVTVENYGRTPGFIKRVDWGLCEEKKFLTNIPVSEIIERGLLKEIMRPPVEYEDVYPGGQAVRLFRKAGFPYRSELGKIFFGRFLYRDVFDDLHHSTFKLRLGTRASQVESEPLPGCYSDWS